MIDIINKAKNGDYNDLDEVMSNIKEEKDNIPINPDLKNLKDFCSQQLNLTAQTDHERVREVLIEKIYKKENGSVKELVLLAIAANDTLVERCGKMHEGILFTQDEDLDRLLLGVGGQCYIKFLLEHLGKKLSSIPSWHGIYEKLKRASSIGNQECVKAILNRFEDTGIESRDPAIKLLHYAVEKGNYDLVNLLIKNGANVNIQDRNGKTALHYAVSSYGDLKNVNEMVMLLVESGADVDIQDSDGKTALHYAAASNKDEIVRLLLKEGANEEIKDKSGKTFLGTVASDTQSFLLNVLHPKGLLHWAAKEDNIGRAKRLLAKGKDVNAKNSYGKSPLSVAIKYNRLEIVKLFLEKRAEIDKKELREAIGAGNLKVIKLLVSKNAVIIEEAIQYAQNVYKNCKEDKKQAHSSVLTFLMDVRIREVIEQGDLERIKSLVKEGAVISGEIIQCARDACKNCKEDKNQAHSSVLTFLVNIHIRTAIKQGNLKRIKPYVDKGTVITEETIQYAREVCKDCKEDRKQAHSSVLKFLEKTSKDQFEEAIKQGNLERIKFLVEKGAVITEEIKKCAQHAYKDCKERRVYIANYPGGMKAERQNRKEILGFLEGKNSNLVNETATSNQVVDEENNNRSQNPAPKNQQPQENVDRRENIMNNEEASIEEAIGNDYRRGKMPKSKKTRKQKLDQQLLNAICNPEDMENYLEKNGIKDELTLKSILGTVNTKIQEKENTNVLGPAKSKRSIAQKKRLLNTKNFLIERINSIGIDAKAAASSVKDVSATASNQVTPVSEDVSQDIQSEILDHYLAFLQMSATCLRLKILMTIW